MRLHRFLCQLEWGQGIVLDDLEFMIIDRGAPDDRRSLASPEVEGRDRSYLHLMGGGRVPYHRVLEVLKDGEVLWRRGVLAKNGAVDDGSQ